MSDFEQQNNDSSRTSNGSTRTSGDRARAPLLSPGWRSHCRECGWRTGHVAISCSACGARLPSLRPRVLWQAPIAAVVIVAVVAALSRLLNAVP